MFTSFLREVFEELLFEKFFISCNNTIKTILSLFSVCVVLRQLFSDPFNLIRCKSSEKFSTLVYFLNHLRDNHLAVDFLYKLRTLSSAFLVRTTSLCNKPLLTPECSARRRFLTE